MSGPAEFFCLRCHRCIQDASQLRTHFQECRNADIQKIAYVPPPWERSTFDVHQFRDFSDPSDTRDHVTHTTRHPEYPEARRYSSTTSVDSSELESLSDETLFIPCRRKKITLGLGVHAFFTGRPLPRKASYGYTVINPLWIGDELHGDIRVARVVRPSLR
ncbi:hypothetical protein HI914_00950 [Erysiphe necator]|nr:hypothetical protein HI914_00950 [Erysiphe necator]